MKLKILPGKSNRNYTTTLTECDSRALIYYIGRILNKNMRVLVCDDDEVVLKVVEVTLREQGYEAVLTRDGQEAMAALTRGEHFDLIITDIHMPYVNGDDILKHVREEQGKPTPIIMLSSDGEEEVIALALKQGVNEFLVKPVNTRDLLKKINKLLG
jgi:DNA-binding response OmpR family regulator